VSLREHELTDFLRYRVQFRNLVISEIYMSGDFDSPESADSAETTWTSQICPGGGISSRYACRHGQKRNKSLPAVVGKTMELRFAPDELRGSDRPDLVRIRHDDWYKRLSDLLFRSEILAPQDSLKRITHKAVSQFAFHPAAVHLNLFSMLEDYVFGFAKQRLLFTWLRGSVRFTQNQIRLTERFADAATVKEGFFDEGYLQEHPLAAKQVALGKDLNELLLLLKEERQVRAHVASVEGRKRNRFALVRFCMFVFDMLGRNIRGQISTLANFLSL
jgi:hypothetical protein